MAYSHLKYFIVIKMNGKDRVFFWFNDRFWALADSFRDELLALKKNSAIASDIYINNKDAISSGKTFSPNTYFTKSILKHFCVRKSCRYIDFSDSETLKKYGIRGINGRSSILKFVMPELIEEIYRNLRIEFVVSQISILAGTSPYHTKIILNNSQQDTALKIAQYFNNLIKRDYSCNSGTHLVSEVTIGEFFNFYVDGKLKDGINSIKIKFE